VRAERGLVVVGGGPAGCAAAITAAEGGVAVTLVDKARFPRDKCCGDGLTTAALRDLEALGVDPRRLPSFTPTPELVLQGASGRRALLALGDEEGIAAAVCRRLELDAALVARAREEGVTVLEGEAFSGLSLDEGGVELALSGGARLRAGAVVAADGAWSAVRKALPEAAGARAAPLHWHAYRAYYSSLSEEAERRLLVAFEDALLPGYAWSFPLGDGTANVGVCLPRTTRRPGATLAELCEATLSGPALGAFLGASARREGPLRSWPIPAPVGSLPLVAGGGRVLFVGDAARAADPFSGEGIGQALLTGRAAGRALATATGQAAAAAYRAELAGGLLPDQRLASWCNAAMRHRPTSRAAIALAGAHPRVGRAFGRWLYEEYPRPDLFRPWRWRRSLPRRALPFSAAA